MAKGGILRHPARTGGMHAQRPVDQVLPDSGRKELGAHLLIVHLRGFVKSQHLLIESFNMLPTMSFVSVEFHDPSIGGERSSSCLFSQPNQVTFRGDPQVGIVSAHTCQVCIGISN